MPNIYRLALQVQDASNINGVVHSLEHEVLPAIRQEPGYAEQGTAYVSKHPVVLLFLDKLVSLTGVGWIHDMDMQIADAYSTCHDHVDAEDQRVVLVAPEMESFRTIVADIERNSNDDGYAF